MAWSAVKSTVVDAVNVVDAGMRMEAVEDGDGAIFTWYAVVMLWVEVTACVEVTTEGFSTRYERDAQEEEEEVPVFASDPEGET